MVLAAGAPLSLTARETYAQPQDADEFWTRQWRRHIDTVEQLRRFRPPPASVLDVGCGTGALSARLAELGYAIQGCDCLPPDGVNVAPAGFVYSPVDLDNEGLSPHYATSPPFDAVVCSDVIEHLENPAKALREIAGVLHRDGLAFITLPNAFNIFERAALALTGNSTRYRFSTPAERGHSPGCRTTSCTPWLDAVAWPRGRRQGRRRSQYPGADLDPARAPLVSACELTVRSGS